MTDLSRWIGRVVGRTAVLRDLGAGDVLAVLGRGVSASRRESFALFGGGDPAIATGADQLIEPVTAVP
ncbi:hypothetical protein [Bradyrhizobium sp. CCBAU 53421]|uniref:hypothetical protein n=1 Tax=Bradyrhizobium sp. CCBAU 53421 TaxID=1325120 RepID=UPI00188B79BA|nr:hypothetical protein [Bradyrhizobium sp. CCBAU 53421]QOZ32948.1 hypothetical protein XH92_15800 [Bradyrhizobium sp. CCBAU 53421]